jgi:O-antigen/teichoic acid export membrane protein
LTKVIFPGFASIRSDPARLASAYQRAQALVTAVALPAGFGAALIADPLIRLAMGEKWVPVIFLVQVLASVFALQTLGSLSEPLGMAQGQTRLLFIRNLQMLFIRVPIIVIGMLLAGLKGVVIARVVSGLISIFLAMRLVRRFTGLGVAEQLAANVRAFISVAVMSLGVIAISPFLDHGTDSAALLLRIASMAVIAAALYCGTSMLLWHLMQRPSGPEREFQQLLAKMLAKVRPA